MTYLTEASSQWYGRIQSGNVFAADEKLQKDKLRAKSVADWGEIRPKILAAVGVVAQDYPPGSSFTLSGVPGSPPNGAFTNTIDAIALKVSATMPYAATCGWVLAMPDYTVYFGGRLYGPDLHAYDMGRLKDYNMEGIIRRSIVEALLTDSEFRALPPWTD